MMRALAGVIALLAAACGPSATTGPAPAKPQPQPQTPAQPPPTQPQIAPQAAGELTVQDFCDRYAKLSQCPWYSKIGMDHDSCLTTFSSADPQAQQALKVFGPCVRDHTNCAEVADCFAATAPPQDDLRACNESKPEHAVGMPRAEWEHRKGAGLAKYSQATTTKASPIEVCGIPTENEWLAQLSCDDGSHPITSRGAAESVRVGNVGSGGRCGSIIDLYRVTCPEKSYDIYIDGYVCPQP